SRWRARTSQPRGWRRREQAFGIVDLRRIIVRSAVALHQAPVMRDAPDGVPGDPQRIAHRPEVAVARIAVVAAQDRDGDHGYVEVARGGDQDRGFEHEIL